MSVVRREVGAFISLPNNPFKLSQKAARGAVRERLDVNDVIYLVENINTLAALARRHLPTLFSFVEALLGREHRRTEATVVETLRFVAPLLHASSSHLRHAAQIDFSHRAAHDKHALTVAHPAQHAVEFVVERLRARRQESTQANVQSPKVLTAANTKRTNIIFQQLCSFRSQIVSCSTSSLSLDARLIACC